VHGAPVIAADDAQTDHGFKASKINGFAARGMDLGQIAMLGKGVLGQVRDHR